MIRHRILQKTIQGHLGNHGHQAGGEAEKVKRVEKMENTEKTENGVGETGVLVAFRVMKGSSHALTNQFCKKFYGQDTSSHGGKYRYRRPGFLDDIPHHKLIRGVLVFRERDADKVAKFLGEYNAEIHVRRITLTKSDVEALSEQTPKTESNTH